MPLPGCFTPRKETQYPLHMRLGGPAWMGAEHLATTRIQPPDHPARNKSLYRLRYPGPKIEQTFILLWYIIRGSVSTTLLSMPLLVTASIEFLCNNWFCWMTEVLFFSCLMSSYVVFSSSHSFTLYFQYIFRQISFSEVLCCYHCGYFFCSVWLGHATLVYLLVNYFGYKYAILWHNKITNNL
jgi:hypothetical protein